MEEATRSTFDSELDLVLERVVEVPRELLWKGWTEPELLKQWFVPRPWSITDCRTDLRPGGEFYTVMRSPQGDEFPSAGCYLEIVPHERLVFTEALAPGFRPIEKPFFTAVVTFEEVGPGRTRYRVVALHATPEARQKHEEMGFHEGWGQTLDQLVELVGGIEG